MTAGDLFFGALLVLLMLLVLFLCDKQHKDDYDYPDIKAGSHGTHLLKALDRWQCWLDLEIKAEEDQNREMLRTWSEARLSEEGISLAAVYVIGGFSDFFDKAGKRWMLNIMFGQRQRLPDHKLSSGDAVMVSRMSDFRQPLFRGTVEETAPTFIRLTADPDCRSMLSSDTAFFIMRSANPVTHRRMCRVITQMRKPSTCVGYTLVKHLFVDWGLQTSFGFEPPCLPISVFYDQNLNNSQQQAVKRCVNRGRPVSVIHGPPGTGKTQTLTEVIAQCVFKNGEKLLVCAPSNIAVDNVMERVVWAHPKLKVLRLGNPVRVSSDLHARTFDAQMRKAMDSSRSDGRVGNRTEVARNLIGSTQVVFSTLASCPDDEFPLYLMKHKLPKKFDLCIIDECAQSLEVACWIGLIQSRRCVLAGDHHQLPPTVKSEGDAKEGLSLSLMERLSNDLSVNVKGRLFTLLNVQYRMNEHIMRWSSDTFYNSQLMADVSVQSHLLRHMTITWSVTEEINESDLPGVGRLTSGPADLHRPLVLIDTCRRMPEQQQMSCSNPAEVRLVYLYVRALVEQGVQQSDIAVISPYSAQVQLLRQRVGSLYPQVSIRTVDGFQGQEREVVVMSFVRSNKRGNVGFLCDARRLNVAVTRARRQLCVVADVQTVSSDARLRTLVEHMQHSPHALLLNDQLKPPRWWLPEIGHFRSVHNGAQEGR